MPLGLLFILTLITELAVLIKVGGLIGVLPTIAILILSAASGITLLKQHGVRSMLKMHQKMRSGELPIEETQESMIISMCCFLLILPGFITDIVALCGLIPFVRHRLMRWFLKRVYGKKDHNVVEGEYTDISDHNTHIDHCRPEEDKDGQSKHNDEKMIKK